MPEDGKALHQQPLFLDSEPRFVYARDKRLGADAPLVFLPNGEAESLRLDCRDGHLWCPYPGCGIRFITTRSGKRRHCFVHKAGVRESVHQPESYFHILGKELVFQWARQRYPSAQVQQEATVENGQRADVLVTLDGRRFAFEIQYAPLGPEEARRRHRGYRELGIIDVWLLGHRPPHLVKAKHHQSGAWPLVEMSQSQRLLIELEAQCFWIVPEGLAGGAIATAWTMSHRQVARSTSEIRDGRHRLPVATGLDEWSWQHTPAPSDARMYLEASPLSECALEEQFFVTPTLRRLWEEKARIDSLTARRIDAIKREADLQNAVPVEPIGRWDSLGKQGVLFPGSTPPADTAPKEPHTKPGPPSPHDIHSTLAALQKHPWFIVHTCTRNYTTGVEDFSFEVRNMLQVGSQEGTRRPMASLEEGIAWVQHGGHEVVVLTQEVLSLKGSPFMWAPPIPLNWTLDGAATRRLW